MHRDELGRRGALLKLCGQTWVVEGAMDAAVLDIGAAAMQAQAAEVETA